MSFRLVIFTKVASTLTPDEAMFFRLNRWCRGWIEKRVLSLSRGWFNDLRQRLPSSVILLQLVRTPKLSNEYISHTIDDEVLRLHPLQCTTSIRILKLLLDYGSDPDTLVPRLQSPLLLDDMISHRAWVPEYLTPLEGEERVLDYCVKVKHNQLALLLHQRGAKLPPHTDPILFVDQWFYHSERPLFLFQGEQKTLLTAYKGRALTLVLRFLFNEFDVNNVVIGIDRKEKGIYALETLDAWYTPDRVHNSDVAFRLQELIFPHYVTVRNTEGKRFYLQFPLEYKEEYEQGIRLAHELYATMNKA